MEHSAKKSNPQLPAEDYKPTSIPHAWKVLHGSMFPTKGERAVTPAGSLQTLGSMKFAAIRCVGLDQFDRLIPEVAKRWSERLHAIPNRVHPELHFGIAPCSSSQDASDTHTYYLAVEVSDFAGIPEEFDRLDLRAALYAVVRKEPGADAREPYGTARAYIESLGKKRAANDAEPIAYQLEIFYESMEAYCRRVTEPDEQPFVMDLCIPVEDGEAYRPTAVPAALQALHRMHDGSDSASTDVLRAEGVQPVERFVPSIVFDGGKIATTLEDHEEAIAWFERHAGWKIARSENWKPAPQAVQGRMTHMGWGVWIESGVTEEGVPVPPVTKERYDPYVRWRWKTADLAGKRQELLAAGVRVSEVYSDPQGRASFDLWATKNEMLLTVVEDPAWNEPSLGDANQFRITVSDLSRSIEWYRHYIGMELVMDRSEQGYAVMTLGINYHPEGRSEWILEEQPDRPVTGPVDGMFRPRCIIQSRDAFFRYHGFLQESGAQVSEVFGFLQRGMVYCHVYDPDGNRFDLGSM